MRPHIAVCVETKAHPGAEIAFTYRCCGNPRTDSTINIPLLYLTDDAEIELRKQVYAANVEMKHEAANAVMQQLAQKQTVDGKDHQGYIHKVAIHRVEHWADEIVRVHYHCCSDSDHAHIEEIDYVHRHTPDEVDARVASHADSAAKLHTATLKARAIEATGNPPGSGGEGDAKKSL